jgi:hypothetical protein
LFDGVKFALLFLGESKIEAAHFTSVLDRFSRAFANGFDNFRFHRAAFNTLFAGVFGQADRLHRFISSKTR